MWLHLAETEPDGGLDFCEVFAGTGAVHRGLLAHGLRGRAIDLSYDEGHNVLKPEGLLLVLSTILDLKPGAILWAAPPCSSWIFMSRGSTGRHKEVQGYTWLPKVVVATALVERLVLALELATLRGAHWIVEQPGNTVMWEYPAMRDCLRRHGVRPCSLEMGSYGAMSWKRTTLMGTAPYLPLLERTCSRKLKLRLQVEGVQTAKKWKDANGQPRCQGTKDLKGTQSYPEAFGAAHGLLYLQTRGASQAEDSAGPSPELDRRALLAKLQQQLPATLLSSLQGAWWLRNFLGEPWP